MNNHAFDINTTWTKAIKEARKCGRFSSTEKLAAGSWVTCACGKQDEEIPRHYDGEPMDGKLSLLGMEFFGAVQDDNFNAASKLLTRINRRAAAVLRKVRS